VYFGGQVDHKGPYGWPGHQRLFRLGKYRYILYDKELSFMENLRLIASRQIYEFVIKYETNLYINVSVLDNSANLYHSSQLNRKYD
jgi:hypothetical protein